MSLSEDVSRRESTSAPTYFHQPPARYMDMTPQEQLPEYPTDDRNGNAASAHEAQTQTAPTVTGPMASRGMGGGDNSARSRGLANRHGYATYDMDTSEAREAEESSDAYHAGRRPAPEEGGSQPSANATSRATSAASNPTTGRPPQPTQESFDQGPGPVSANDEEDEERRFNEVERRARVALEAIAVRDEDVEVNMSMYVATLREYRIACEARQMYREAHLVQQVLRNLRLEEETRHVRGLTEMQMEERSQLEETHRAEFREFHRMWNAKIDEFEEAQLEMEITLLERQNEELLRFHEEMRNFDPRGIPRFSRSLLAARQKQQALAKQRSYVAAQEEKLRGDAIELMDIERYENTRAQMYERKEYALRYQHQQELLALRLKVEGKRLYLEKTRKRELDEVLQRYINARNEMEVQQNIVRNKTGALLLKHACNAKTDSSGSAALVESAYSGTFGSIIQKRAAQEQEQRTLKERGSSTPFQTVSSPPPDYQRGDMASAAASTSSYGNNLPSTSSSAPHQRKQTREVGGGSGGSTAASSVRADYR